MSNATVKGRGGTDFKAFWDLLKTDKRFLKVKPDLIMIFTDGHVDQLKRDRKTMNHLCWCIIDNTSFKVEHSDAMTRCIHIKSADIK
jgi:predicted metal-dependent peptidase